MEGLGDTIDLVPVGTYAGEGKRSGGFGAFLLAARDTRTGQFHPVCKLGSGFTEADLEFWSREFGWAEQGGGGGGGDGGEGVFGGGDESPPWLEMGPLPPHYRPYKWIQPTTVWEVHSASPSH